MKKYRLEIPEEYIPILPAQAKYFNNSIVAVVNYNGEYCEVELNEVTLNVFVTWLTEIEEPKTFDEWINDYCIMPKLKERALNGGNFTIADMRECHKWTIKNERLRYRDLFNAYNQWIDPCCDNNDILIDEFEKLRESHNLEE